jgi:hypothetical protein
MGSKYHRKCKAIRYGPSRDKKGRLEIALFKGKIKLDDDLRERVERHVEEVGFASVEEFVAYCLEKELAAREESDEAKVAERLRGLGYIE